jgi:Ca2+-binding RTX toxin-like protein
MGGNVIRKPRMARRPGALAGAAAVALVAVGAPTALSAQGEITTAAGTTQGLAGDGGQASAAQLDSPTGVAPTADGGFLIADTFNHRIRRVAPNGVITTAAGTTGGLSGDGGQASAAQLNSPFGVAPTADGGFLIADQGNHRIRRVAPNGVISTAAGTTSGLSGDGGQASAAQLNSPGGVAPTADGGFLIADRYNHRIRRVAPDGVISTAAGSTQGLSGDGGQASAAQLNSPGGVAPTADGGFLIADQGNDRIRRVAPSGVISTAAGTTGGLSGDGGQASAAQLNFPNAVAPTADGGYLIADSGNHRIRRVAPDGVISTAAGTTGGLSGDGGQASAAQLDTPFGVAPTADGGFLIADTGNHRIRAVEGLSCLGRRVTILGTPGNDVLAGTPGPDVIGGLGGADLIRGGGRRDLICAGAGNDRVLGGPGNDLIDGGPGVDRLVGQGGNDRILGRAGRDLIRGGPGRDRLLGGTGPDRLFGGPGRDRLLGQRGNDRLSGGRGRDLLNGGPGRDRCLGAPGRDRYRRCAVRR